MIVEAFNKKLNPKIWDHDNNLYKDVRDKVLEIVTYFNDYVTIPLNILDIQIVGSNASYNWNENSDLDIHIICDFSIYNYADIEILKALYNAEKTQFNNSYDIVIKGIEAEVYVEDVNQTTISNGIYSLKDGWIKFPNKLDDIVVQNISSDLNKWVQLITDVKDGNSQDGAQELLDKIYMIRKNSLAVDGEYGAGNLLFKALRAKGYIQDLRNLRDKDISKKLTLEDLRFNKSTKLFEANRTQLINKSKNSEKGRQRYNRRVKSRMANAVRDFNSIDMNKLFKDDILAVDVTVHGETDDYKVRMSFGGFLEILRDQIEKAGKLDLRAITRALVIGFNRDDVYIHCTCPDFCLHEDTKIKLLNNEVLSIKDIYERFKNNEELWVYSVDENGDFKPGKVTDVWISGKVKNLIKVILDNDKEIITTPNHRYMLRDGSFLEASSLKEGQSLMPLYFSYHDGYECVKLNSQTTATTFQSVYKIVADKILSDKIEEAKDRSKEDTIEDAIEYFSLNNNYDHKIKRIEIVQLDTEVPVYDLTVDKYNNFYVDAGVILHNCYRFDYYATRNIYNSGEPQNISSKITNPRDSLGSGCKHILLLLSNTAWLIKVASVINNYIKYTQKNMQRAYTDIIYPAIYGKEYEEPVQLSIFDKDDLDTDETTIDKSNQYGRTSTQFKKGNTQGVRFAPNNSNDDQITIDDEFFN